MAGVSSRSGSLERRRSGEDSPVLNQSTVHGIASPNRRPTIFDVFRPRAKSDAKRQKEKHLLDPSSADSSATSSTYSVSGGTAPATSSAGAAAAAGGAGAAGAAGGGAGAAGGLMNSMKVAMQNFSHRQHPAVTITSADGTQSTAKSKYKDGSAHPHQGSDAQVSPGLLDTWFTLTNFNFLWAVLPHGDGGASELFPAVADDQGYGPVPASIQFSGQRSRQTQSGKFQITLLNTP